MTLLDKYILKQFIKNLSMVLGALVSIYFLVDFFERIDNFMEAGKGFGLAIRYFIMKIPFMVDMLQPVCILLTGVISLGLLNNSNELMALNAGGISLMRVATPIIIIGIICSFLALAMAEFILPTTLSITNKIWYEDINHKIPKGILRKGRYYHKGEEGIYNFTKATPDANVLKNFSYTRINEDYSLDFILTAPKATWENGAWSFYNGQIKHPVATDGRYDIQLFDTISLKLPESPNDFFAPVYHSNEQSISSLLSKAFSSQKNSADLLSARVGIHSRLSFIFLGIPLIMLGLPILLIIHRRWGHDLTLAIPLSCGLAFVAWGWWSTSISMAKASYISPLPAAWSMHLLITPLGWWILKRLDR